MYIFRSILARHRLADESGAVLAWFAITIPVIIGMFALSLDLGRVTTMDTELKSVADAAALAAAQQLDGKTDSITRANAAAFQVVNGAKFAQSYAGGGGPLLDLVYSETREGLDGSALLDEASTADSKKAGWVQARSSTGSASTFFIPVVGGATTMSTAVQSTAGTGYVACGVTPLRICDAHPTRWDDPNAIGKQFKLKARNGVDGDFGVVDSPNDPHGNQTASFLASQNPNFCFVNNVTVDPGQSTSAVYDGLNVRFSIYPQGNGGTAQAMAQFPPAPNITKGNPGNSCLTNSVTHGPPGALPRDTAFANDWEGNKTYDRSAYITTNYGSNLATTNPTLYAALTGAATRYDMYLAELGITRSAEDTPMTDATIRAAPGMQRTSTEKPYPLDKGTDSPMCAPLTTQHGQQYTSNFASFVPSRRVFYAAIVNCDGTTGNATPPRRSNKYAKFFMTEPVTKPSDPTDAKTVFGEFLGLITPNDGSGKLHAIVQLYANPQDGN